MSENVNNFEDDSVFIRPNENKRIKTLYDYDGFVEKFKPKKTTDDCYTPKKVYDAVVEFVKSKCNIYGLKIVRPFYPGGDYEACDYPDDVVVIDNPPFSIISKITRFYIKNNVKFFLFAPHLTLFSSDLDCTKIVCGAPIIYDNGANIKTSFVTNLMGDIGVCSSVDLLESIKRVQDEDKKESLPKYEYPANVITVSMIQWCLDRGIEISFNKNQIRHVKCLDSQKSMGKSIFGSGFLTSDKAAADKAAAEKAAAEKDNIIIFELSDREREIIRELE